MSIKTDILKNIYNGHAATINYGFKSVDLEMVEAAGDLLSAAIIADKNIFTIGNGASAAIAQHWACDYTKGCAKETFKPKVISLAANIPLMTAIGNDISFDEVYSFQLDKVGRPGDVLIIISSSGNSPNVIRALEQAKSMGIKTIALTGFSGGLANGLADVPIHVNVKEYEATEDVHQGIMHILAKYLRARFF